MTGSRASLFNWLVLQEVRKFDKRIKTVVGGHHATILPGDFARPFVVVIFQGMADEEALCAPCAADRIPFILLALLRIYALRLYLKVRHRYKIEPLV